MPVARTPEPEPVRRPPEPAAVQPAPAPRPTAVAAVTPARTGRSAPSSGLPGGLIDDIDSETVERSAINSKVAIGGRSGDSPSALSKEQVTGRLDDIKRRLKSTKVIDRRDAEFSVKSVRSIQDITKRIVFLGIGIFS